MRTLDPVALASKLASKMPGKLRSGSKGYFHFPTSEAEEENKKQQQKIFVATLLDEFSKQCVAALSGFTAEDSDSVITNNPTGRALKFLSLLTFLESNGFSTPRQFAKPLSFWSGRIAQEKAFQETAGISDSRVPAISVMFDVCQSLQEIQGRYDAYILILSAAISRIFALHTQGVVNVYLNSEKSSEAAGFTIPNNFWLVELPTLMDRYHQKIVTDIVIYLYDHQKKIWLDGVSLFSKKGEDVQIYRRDLHPLLDDKKNENRFKKVNATPKEREEWKKSSPRPSITYGKLKYIARSWQERTSKVIENKRMAQEASVRPEMSIQVR